MSIGHAKMYFNDNNILSICGYNNVGKSATTRSMEIAFYNSYSSDQAKFIKDNEDYWQIRLEFDDGVIQDRYKYSDGKSVWEMYKDGKLVFSNRVGDSVASMQDIPEVVSDYLGVVRDDYTGEKLNVRRNTDKLFLINTTGGDNYKILNSILRSDVLAEASKKLAEDKNKLQAKMQSTRTACDTLKEESNGLDVVPKEVVDSLKGNIYNLKVSDTKYKDISSVRGKYSEYKDIVIYDELPLINTTKLKDVQKIAMLHKESSIVIPPKLNEVKIDRLREISTIKSIVKAKDEVIQPQVKEVNLDKLKAINNIVKLSKEVNEIVAPEAKEINLDKLKMLSNIRKIVSEYVKAVNDTNSIDAEYSDVTKKLQEFASQGYKICGNCGSAVI